MSKSRTITIKKKDVFFDIDALSLSYAEVSGGDNAVRVDAVSSETDTAAGTRKFKRLADRRAADLNTVMRRFLATVTASSADDQLSTSDYVYSLTVDDEFEDSMIEPITAEMHDYIVKGALADWFNEIGIKGQHDTLAAEAESAVARIRELIYYRPIPAFRS